MTKSTSKINKKQEQHPPMNDITFKMRTMDDGASTGSAGSSSSASAVDHDNSTTEKYTITSRSGNSENEGSGSELAGKESKAVFRSKLLVYFVLFVAAVSVTVLAYRSTREVEVTSFEHDVDLLTEEIEEVAEGHVKKILAMAKGISTDYTSHAAFAAATTSAFMNTSSSSSGSWPYLKLPFFEIRGREARAHSNAKMIAYAPIIHHAEKDTWEAYVEFELSNSTGVRHPIHSIDDHYNNHGDGHGDSHDSHRRAVKADDDGHEDGHGVAPPDYYVPLWQLNPAKAGSREVNLDLASYKPIKKLTERVIETREPALSEILDLAFLNEFIETSDHTAEEHDGHIVDENGNEIHPHAMLVYPVFENFDDVDRHHDGGDEEQDNSAKIQGFVFAIFPWEIIFMNDELIYGMYAVLTDTCGYNNRYTYYIHEKKVKLLGQGALHETRFNNYGRHSSFELELDEVEGEDEDGNNSAGQPAHTMQEADIQDHHEHNRRLQDNSNSHDLMHMIEDENCVYHFDIYPSSKLYELYVTNDPLIYAIVVAAIFIGTALVFILYEHLVQNRQNVVMKTATNANAIVTSMFPKEIQLRMMQDAEEQANKKKNKSQGNNAFSSKGAKGKLETFVDGGMSTKKNVNPFATKPIAELYPACTIMMADICGFTAWSSAREPSQVFTCLETIYHAFDMAAEKHRVFKVETVGDCYVAVAGVPKANARHSVAMARYARNCLSIFKKIVRGLEISLGPDTSALDVRFGLHSGPVTAGVLRGDKARFQLFGEVVNTTSQIESSSKAGRIHVSVETADLLKQAGLSSWLEERLQTVYIKGKGEVQTFWLTQNVRSPGSVASMDEVGWAPAVGDLKGLDIDSKTDRLVEWNTEQLVRLLKEVEARRRLISTHKRRKSKPGLGQTGTAGAKGKNPLDEWKEIIALPKEVINGSLSTDDIEFDTIVVEEIRDYIKTIASMYNENAFHCFEHASHVANSVNKLLARIVTHEKDEDTVTDPTYGITSDPLTRFACVFSSLIHDVDHPGVPNPQLIKEKPDLAELYHGKSVAEQYSIDLSWSLLMEAKYTNFRAALFTTQDEMKRFRELVVNSVLATDIMDKELKNLRNGRWDKAFKDDGDEIEQSKDDVVNRKATIVIEHLIQASDVSHTMQHWDVYRTWNQRFFRECYQAYLDGRADKDPSVGWYKGEIGFYDFYIIPLAKKLADCGVFGVSSFEYLNYAQKNRDQWEREGEAVVKEFLAEFSEEKV